MPRLINAGFVVVRGVKTQEGPDITDRLRVAISNSRVDVSVMKEIGANRK